MTRNATGSLSCARTRAKLPLLALFAGACLVPAAPALAQEEYVERSSPGVVEQQDVA